MRKWCYAEFWDSLDCNRLGTAIAASLLATTAAAVTVSANALRRRQADRGQ